MTEKTIDPRKQESVMPLSPQLLDVLEGDLARLRQEHEELVREQRIRQGEIDAVSGLLRANGRFLDAARVTHDRSGRVSP